LDEHPLDTTYRNTSYFADTPAGRLPMKNIVAKIPGERQGIILLATHYDTKRLDNFVGADDGGSSTGVMLELARKMCAMRPRYSIWIAFFDGEEAVLEWSGSDHTYGSRHYVALARKNGSLATLKAFVLVDMIGDRDLRIKRDQNSTPWLTTIIWDAAREQKLTTYFPAESTQIEDDHLEFTAAGIPSVDIIDLEFGPWHTAGDNLNSVSAGSLQVVGDVVVAALPQIEARVK